MKPAFAARLFAFVALSVALNFAGVSEIRALFVAAVLNGVIAPILLVVIMLAASDRRVLGDFVPGRALIALGWTTAAIMAAATILMFVTFL